MHSDLRNDSMYDNEPNPLFKINVPLQRFETQMVENLNLKCVNGKCTLKKQHSFDFGFLGGVLTLFFFGILILCTVKFYEYMQRKRHRNIQQSQRRKNSPQKEKEEGQIRSKQTIRSSEPSSMENETPFV